MNIEVRQPVHGAKDSGKARVGIFDCDIHPKSSLEDLRPYLRVCPKTSGGITKFSEHEAD